MIIGIDIGGTNTDAVLVDSEGRILSAVKTTTTGDISIGVATALQQLLKQTLTPPEKIQGVFVGTTHATNAILQKKDLFRVGVLRIAGQRPETLPPGFSWPQDLKNAVIAEVETINGGLECHGGMLTPFCEREACQALQKLKRAQVESLAIIGVFSPLNGMQEREMANLSREVLGPSFPLSLSCEIGGIGFIERENSTILNACLKKVMQQGFDSLQATCRSLCLTCPLMITQNDGSLIAVQRAIDYPILTISAGPTNSFIGGSRLSGKENAIIVDIGGTSTDVGLVRQGFPLRSLNKSTIGGVLLNFPMPDVLSIALGGGSKVDCSAPLIGPASVGKALATQALSFGGNVLTLTDVALVMGYTSIPYADPTRVHLNPVQGNIIFDQIKNRIQELTIKIQGEHNNLPLIFVGGGAGLLPPSFLQGEIPPYFDVANAYGAALAEISGSIDTVVSLQNREEVLQELYTQAKQKAIDQGANPMTLRLIDQQIIPYSYVPNQMARVIVRYCGKRLEKNATHL